MSPCYMHICKSCCNHTHALVYSHLWRGYPKQIADVLRPMETLRPSRVSHFGSAASPCEYHWKKWHPRATKLGCNMKGTTLLHFTHWLVRMSCHLFTKKTGHFRHKIGKQISKKRCPKVRTRLAENVAFLRGLRPSMRSAGCLCLWETCHGNAPLGISNDTSDMSFHVTFVLSHIQVYVYVFICLFAMIYPSHQWHFASSYPSLFRAISWTCMAVKRQCKAQHEVQCFTLLIFTNAFSGRPSCFLMVLGDEKDKSRLQIAWSRLPSSRSPCFAVSLITPSTAC